tara:strand:- start:234 stop:827 length:594 start_codon:yes stop_codon:yes gene_type:complete
MNKSQFNIKISKDLLASVKRQAIMSGKNLTEHITDLLKKSLAENDFNNYDLDTDRKIKDIEKRLIMIESTLGNREYIAKKLKPFTTLEAINCTKFMRGFFDQEIEKRKLVDRKKAFIDFLDHINVYVQLNKEFTDRLEEIMLNDRANPWTEKELNLLADSNKCNCPIRFGLINWTRRFDCPSQQEICEKGEKLLPLL